MPDGNDELISQPAEAETPPAKMTPEELKEARRKFESGQTTRRAALRKIGITAGAAFFAMFAVEDLARIAGKRLEQMQIDNKIADDLAKELRSAGVAFAGEMSPSPDTAGPCTNFAAGITSACSDCNNERNTVCTPKCDRSCGPPTNCGFNVCGGVGPTYAALQACWASVCAGCLANCS